MPLIYWASPDTACPRTRSLPTPKKQTLEAYHRAARKLIPEIPSLEDPVYHLHSQEASLTHIRWVFINKTDNSRHSLTIDRTKGGLGL